MPQITVIGSLNSDLVTLTPRVPAGGETLTASSFSTGPGGKGSNQAVACARLSRSKASPSSSDVTIKMIGAVGADEFGPQLIATQAASGIDTTGIRQVEGVSTGVAVILVEENTGENRILLSPGANRTLEASEFVEPESLGTPLPDLVVLQLEIPLNTVLQIVKTAKKAGVAVMLNPAPAVPLPDVCFVGLDHLIVNETEAGILTGRGVEEVERSDFVWGPVLDELLSKGCKNVVVTLGAKGAVYASQNGSRGEVPAAKVTKVVDTTAAGDTFVGAYAIGIVRGKEDNVDMEGILTFAAKCSGKTVQKQGAQNSIPWADEVSGSS